MMVEVAYMGPGEILDSCQLSMVTLTLTPTFDSCQLSTLATIHLELNNPHHSLTLTLTLTLTRC